MYLTYHTYGEIVNKAPDNPPENGGILGGHNEIICHVEFDEGMQQHSFPKCCYTPNVKYLNACIAAWKKRHVDFYGVFHTHFYGVSTLSEGDEQYIKKIMEAMPDSKIKLYFPVVVLPERKIISYMCRKDEEGIRIFEDKVNLVENSTTIILA